MFVIQIGLPGASARFLQGRILGKARDLIMVRRVGDRSAPPLETLRAYARCSEIKAPFLRLHLRHQLGPLVLRARTESRTVILADECLATGTTNLWHGRGPTPEKVARRLAEFTSETVAGLTPIRVAVLLRRQDQWLAERYAAASGILPDPSQADFDRRLEEILAAESLSGPLAWLDHQRVYRAFAKELGVDNILLIREERLARRPKRSIDTIADFVESGDLRRTLRRAARAEATPRQTGITATRTHWALKTEPAQTVTLSEGRRRALLARFSESERGLHHLLETAT